MHRALLSLEVCTEKQRVEAPVGDGVAFRAEVEFAEATQIVFDIWTVQRTERLAGGA